MHLGRRLDRYYSEAMVPLVEAGDAGVQAERDGVRIVAVGRGGSEFNSAFVLDPPGDPAGTFSWAVEMLAATGRPYTVQAADELIPAVEPALAAVGLSRSVTLPGMVREPAPEVPPPPSELRISAVGDEDALTASAVAMARGFGAPDPSALVGVLPPGLLDDERVTVLCGSVDDGAPVATAVCVVLDGVAGIFAVSVAERARRRGYGAAMTWAALAVGTRGGAQLVTLQASEMGRSVYAAMGFREVRDYLRYTAE